MKNRAKKAKTTFFDPCDIVSLIHNALTRDLQPCIHSDNAELAFVSRKQTTDFTKKFVIPNSPSEKEKEKQAFSDFLSLCDELSVVKTTFPVRRRIQKETCFMDRVLLKAQSICFQVLGDLSEEEWFLGCRHSPGTSIGLRFVSTNLEDKWKFPISSTERAAPIMERYLAWDSKLAEQVLALNKESAMRYSYVAGSRATTVDKNLKERRMIAVEPTANMFLQQGLMAVMYARLADFGLDLQVLQELHRDLAYYASVTAQKATIDWSKASDRSRLDLVRFLFPPKWFECLDLVRCTHMSVNGQWVCLPMISTMGNATTFPIETLVFWSIAIAVRSTLNGDMSLFPTWEDFKTCSVFGDDCIVETSMAAEFISVCNQLGFRCNMEKSFFSDSEYFRESCGGDFIHGRNVRIYYIGSPVSCRKSALEPWLYTITNGLLKKYISYFGALKYVYDKELWRVISKLFKQYGFRMKIVPPDYPDDSGIRWMDSRLIREYAFETSRLRIDRHGTIGFNFLRFVYAGSDASKVHDGVHYFSRLKVTPRWSNPRFEAWPYGSDSKRAVKSVYTDKKVGGYVVARGLRSWSPSN